MISTKELHKKHKKNKSNNFLLYFVTFGKATFETDEFI